MDKGAVIIFLFYIFDPNKKSTRLFCQKNHLFIVVCKIVIN